MGYCRDAINCDSTGEASLEVNNSTNAILYGRIACAHPHCGYDAFEPYFMVLLTYYITKNKSCALSELRSVTLQQHRANALCYCLLGRCPISVFWKCVYANDKATDFKRICSERAKDNSVGHRPTSMGRNRTKALKGLEIQSFKSYLYWCSVENRGGLSKLDCNNYTNLISLFFWGGLCFYILLLIIMM